MVLITSKNRPGYFWAVDEGTEGYLMRDAEQFRVTSPGMIKLKRKQFRYSFTLGSFIGLNGRPGTITFESVLRPGYYIVNKNGYIAVDSLPNTGFDEGQLQTLMFTFLHS